LAAKEVGTLGYQPVSDAIRKKEQTTGIQNRYESSHRGIEKIIPNPSNSLGRPESIKIASDRCKAL
jgi:hypothetical protein